MRVTRSVALFLCVGLQLGGCASVLHRPPSCDGAARRPMNRSMWDWEAGRPVAASSPAPATAQPQVSRVAPVTPTRLEIALASRPEAASYRACG